MQNQANSWFGLISVKRHGIMDGARRTPCWNIVAILLHLFGVVVALVAADHFGGTESLDGLFFLVPTYAFFCLLAAVAAVVSGVRQERFAALTNLVLLGSVIILFALSGLIASYWSIGFQYWMQKL